MSTKSYLLVQPEIILLLFSIWILNQIQLSTCNSSSAVKILETNARFNSEEDNAGQSSSSYSTSSVVLKKLPIVDIRNTEDNSNSNNEGVQKRRKGNGNKRKNKEASTTTTTSTSTTTIRTTSKDDDSWKLVPLIIPKTISHDDDEIDDDDIKDFLDIHEYDHEEEISDDDDDGKHGPENEEDTLTNRNFHEKFQNSKDRSTNSQSQDERPNIILILTDDQDIELGSMEYMPETLKVFRDEGLEFRHGYVTTPMCCPSRSSILTGLYVHNHQVYTNNDNCSSIQWRDNFEKKTFASYLWDSGYYTSYIGKYLNKYDGSHIPYGWDEFNALLMNSKFYNYTVNRNGIKFRYGNNYGRDYYPNSIANDTINFLQRMIMFNRINNNYNIYNNNNNNENHKNSSSSTNPKKKIQQPFLLVASFPSPHGPEDSAPEYKNLFLNTTSHHTPSYNYAPNGDKQWILRVTSQMNPTLKNFTNLLMAKRLQTLQSVDLAVSKIMKLLKESGLDQNTYVFYTSDHGYHVGQFGLVKGKSMPYEFDIRVPFFISPPKSESLSRLVPVGGTMIYEPVLNIDLAPTFLELGNLPVPFDMDGRSIVPLMKKYSSSSLRNDDESQDYINDETRHSNNDDDHLNWTYSFLIESSGRRETNHHGHGSTQSNNNDPLNTTIKNILANLDLIVDTNNSNNHKKKSSNSNTDRFLIDNETTATELALCSLHPYPCKYGQKKYCRREKNLTRFRKCRNTDFISEIPTEEELPSSMYGIIPNGQNNYYYGGSGGGGNGNENESPLEFIPDGRSRRKCICPRVKRHSSNVAPINYTTEINSDDEISVEIHNPNNATSTSTNWEKQRQMIDDEIELLKLRIEELRERRRKLRRKAMIPGGFEAQNIETITGDDDNVPVSDVNKTKNKNMFRNNSSSSNSFFASPSSFLPISYGNGRHNKKLSQKRNYNNVALLIPTTTTATTSRTTNDNNATFSNVFNLSPNVDFTTTTAINYEDSESKLFHHSDENFDDYEIGDEDEFFEEGDNDNDDQISELFDYSVLQSNQRNNNNKQNVKKSNRKDNNNNNKINNNMTSNLEFVIELGNNNNNHHHNRTKNHHNNKRKHKSSPTRNEEILVVEENNNNNNKYDNEMPIGRTTGRKKSKGKNKTDVQNSTFIIQDEIIQPVGNKDEDSHQSQPSIPDEHDECDCSSNNNGRNHPYNRHTPRWLRQQEKDERKRKKLLSKLRKKQRFLHRIDDPSERYQAESCGSEDKMNCFWHDQSHWRTEPKWTLDSFCFCMNSNNNTYSCLRSINSTHNFLYCHFVTGFKMYFDLMQDPFQLRNMIGSLPAHEEDVMLAQLLKLKKCQGHQDCWIGNDSNINYHNNNNNDSRRKINQGSAIKNNEDENTKELEPSIWERIFGRWRKKQRKHRNHINNNQSNNNNNNNGNGRPVRKFHNPNSE